MISDKAKIPLYGILSNEQLALMAQKIHQKQKYKQFGDVFISGENIHEGLTWLFYLMKRSDNLFNRNRQSKPKFAQRKSIQLQNAFFRLIIFPLTARLERRNFNVQGKEFFPGGCCFAVWWDY